MQTKNTNINQKNTQKLKCFLYFYIVFIMISGIAVAEHNVIVVFHNKYVDLSEDQVISSHGGFVKKNFHLIPAVSARVPDNKIQEMKNDSRIAYVEDDKIYEAADDEYNRSWGVQHIGSEIAYNHSINGTGVKIAVLDTGINYTHEDIKDNYKGGVNLVEYSDPSQNPGPIDDSYNSHGTHVAGIIAAEKNGIGVVGVAPNSSLYSVKVLDGSGFGNLSWIISGIQWAMDNNMSIISMSIEGPYSHALQDACDNAYNSGILLVAAAGNTNGGSVAYPAGYDSVIAVTATNATDYNASFDPIDPKIELAAPGVNIYSTINGGYGYLSGTSMAAPHVTGVAALILSSNFSDVNGDGTKNNKDVRELLHKAKHLGVPGRNNIYGYGLVDVPMALGLSDDGGNFKGILGMTYNDSNRNGKKDPDEVGLANWMIRLLGYDTLTKTPVNRLAVTDANGNYSFTNVTPGSYMVCENFQPNWIPNTSACVWVNLSKDESKIVNFGNVRIWSIPPSFRGLRYQNGT